VRDWVRLAVKRARATGAPASSGSTGTGPRRAGHRQVEAYLKDHDTGGLEIRILAPVDAMKYSLERIRMGLDTISVTGNVLRDYLTDLFPSSRSHLREDALDRPAARRRRAVRDRRRRSAPKHVQQFQKEGYLRWDSLGSSRRWAPRSSTSPALTGTSGLACSARRSTRPSGSSSRTTSRRPQGGWHRQPGQPLLPRDVLAEALAAQSTDAELRARFADVAKRLVEQAATIDAELLAAQGKPVDMGGYYRPDPAKVDAAMRPSPTLNAIIDGMV